MKINGKWPVRLAWVFLILCFLWSGYVTWNATEKLLDGDESSEMVLSSIIAEDGGILTTRWHYSTELRVLYTQLVFAPLFHVFRDWHMIRFVGTMILQALMLLCYGSFCRALGGRRIPCLIGAGLLILPRSVAYGRIVLYATSYTPHLIFNFLLIGLFYHLTRKERRNGLRLAAFLALSFGVGLSGVRHGMLTFAPLLLTVFLRAVRRLEKTELRRLLKEGMGREFVFSAAGSAAWFAGYLVNSRILSGIYVFERIGETTITFPSAADLVAVARAYFNSFGYDVWYELFSVRGLLALLGFFGAAVALACLLRACRDEDPESGSWMAAALCVSTFLIGIGSVLLIARKAQYELHLLPAFSMAIPAIAASTQAEAGRGSARARCLLAAAAALPILLVGLYYSLFFANPASRYLTYSGSVFQNKDNVIELEDTVRFLDEEGYTLGYAPSWQAAVIREMTDGRVKTLAMKGDTLHYRKGWLNEWQLNDPDKLNAEKHFLVTPNDDADILEKVATLQFSGSDYSVWTFESGEALWRYVN